MAINFGPTYPYSTLPYPYNTAVSNTYSGGQANTAVSLNPTNLVIGIQGLNAAKAYPIGPNTRAYMFDTENDFIYIKETKSDGFPAGPLKILACKEITEEELKKPQIETVVPELPKNLVTTDNIEEYIASYLADNNYRPYIPRSERKAQNEERLS